MTFEVYKTAMADFLGEEAKGYEVVAVVNGKEETLGLFTAAKGAIDTAQYVAATTIRGSRLVEARGALLAYGYSDEYIAVRPANIPVFTRTGWYEVWQDDVVRLGRAHTLDEAYRLAERHPDASEIITPTGDVIEL